jgi:outer membrane protein assembly factor BamB
MSATDEHLAAVRDGEASESPTPSGNAVVDGADRSVPAQRPWRTWPAALALALYWGFLAWVWWFEPIAFPMFFVQLFGGLLLGLWFTVWWLCASRSTWREKGWPALAAVGGFGAAMGLAPVNTGIVMILYGIPFATTLGWLAAVVWGAGPQRVGRVAGMLAAVWGLFGLTRYEGVDNGTEAFRWRWTKTAEARFLENRATDTTKENLPATTVAAPVPNVLPVAAGDGDWTGFRGPHRDGAVDGGGLDHDWKGPPPVARWSRLTGPAWTSPIVVAGRVFTLEQRGEQEVLAAHDLASGDEIWAAGHAARYTDPPSGTGPRGTPQFAQGRIVAYGATGELVCVDAATGRELWRKNPLQDVGESTPLWGVSSSPLILGERVIVFAGGSDGRSLMTYALSDGKKLWSAGAGRVSWSSPQRAEINGVEQMWLASDFGIEAFDVDGRALWSLASASSSGRTLQPLEIAGTGFLLFTPDGGGVRRYDVSRDGDKWKVTEGWWNKTWKCNFSDGVIHEGHVYGFDGLLLACLDLVDGRRRWKGGRYGNGQMILDRESGTLLVAAETGELVAVAASPEGHKELGRFPAIEGKSWSHPALVDGLLVLRNAERMAAFDLGGSALAGK